MRIEDDGVIELTVVNADGTEVTGRVPVYEAFNAYLDIAQRHGHAARDGKTLLAARHRLDHRGVAGADARGRQAAGDAPGTFVDLAPRVADGFVRLTRDHAPRAVAGVVIHLVREPAHADLLGFRSDAATGDDAIPLSMVRPKPGCQKKARAHN